MDQIEIKIKVPAEYVQDAEDFGMLNPDTIAQILRDELDERIRRFVNGEIKAYRAERRIKPSRNQEE